MLVGWSFSNLDALLIVVKSPARCSARNNPSSNLFSIALSALFLTRSKRAINESNFSCDSGERSSGDILQTLTLDIPYFLAISPCVLSFRVFCWSMSSFTVSGIFPCPFGRLKAVLIV